MSTVPAQDRPAPRPRRFLVSALAVLVAVFGFLLIGATSASATPDVPDGFPTDGCTLVSDNPTGQVSFYDSCVEHDYCYATHALSRAGCDAALYGSLKGDCDQAYWGHSITLKTYYSCRTWAALYYAGVRAFGAYFYNAPSVATRMATPMR